MKILVIEDDVVAGQYLVDVLKREDYVVDWAIDGAQGFERAIATDADLLLLDVGLPYLDGITLCQQLRAQGHRQPILFLSAKNQQTDELHGLDAGADDYVMKPYDPQILLARIRSVLRRNERFQDGPFQDAPKAETRSPLLTWDALQLDPDHHTVTVHGQSVHLTVKEYGLLHLFLTNPKRTYRRSDILDRLWDIAESPSEGTISTHIKSLRQKLKAAGLFDPIDTVHGLGYRLQVAPVPSAGLVANQQQQAADFVETVWKESKANYIELAQGLIQVLEGNSDRISQQQAEGFAHKLAGGLGIFGQVEGSRVARSLERMLCEGDLSSDEVIRSRTLSLQLLMLLQGESEF
jgi:DNA-binding response OmpR family regulator